MNDILDGLLIVCAVALGIGVLAFWIKMLIRAATLPSSSDKIVWVLIILFAGIIRALIFSFAGPARDRKGADGLTDEDRRELEAMRREFENGPGSRPRVVLTADEERMLAEYRRAYRGDP